MRFLANKSIQNYLAAGLLLVIYGSSGVLGHALHELWGCSHEHSHHCSHGTHSHEHSGGELGHHHDHLDRDSNLAFSAVDDCPICQFLTQAQTSIVVEPTIDEAEPAATRRTWSSISYCSPFLGRLSARGPPLG